MSEIELKPCPFCGRTPKKIAVSFPHDSAPKAKIIQCECGAFLNATRWNIRPVEDALRAELINAKELLALATGGSEAATCTSHTRIT